MMIGVATDLKFDIYNIIMPVFLPSDEFLRYINKKEYEDKKIKNNNYITILAVKKINMNDYEQRSKILDIIKYLINNKIVDDVYINKGDKIIYPDENIKEELPDEIDINKKILNLSIIIKKIRKLIYKKDIDDNILYHLELFIVYIRKILKELDRIKESNKIDLISLSFLKEDIKLLIEDIEKIRKNLLSH